MEVEIKENISLGANPRLSFNQIKSMLNSYISPLNQIKVMTSKNQRVELTSEVLVEMLLLHLDRKQIVELLDMLRIIQGRKSTIQHYLQYILHGMSSYNEERFKRVLNK